MSASSGAHGGLPAVETLIKAGVDIKRDQWIKEAEDCEKSGYVTTCQAIACVLRAGCERLGAGRNRQRRH